MNITVIQSSDPDIYIELLKLTNRTVAEYCQRYRIGHETYIGIKRGYFPWHAAFNRIFIFKELIERGLSGWALYLDADAYVVDFDFDVMSFLETKNDFMAIMTHGAIDEYNWDVNTGIIFLNLNHPLTSPLIQAWLSSYLSIDDATLRGMENWKIGGADQWHLQEVLKRDATFCSQIFYADKKLINAPYSSFIRQHLREETPNFSERVSRIRVAVSAALGNEVLVSQVEQSGAEAALINAVYKGLLNRQADENGLITYSSLIQEKGLAAGLELTIKGIAASTEFKNKINN
jgi:hypothetical protein